jgi:signal transduction histidine kinase
MAEKMKNHTGKKQPARNSTLVRRYSCWFSLVLLVNLLLVTGLVYQRSRQTLADEWRYQLSQMADRVIAEYQRLQPAHLANVDWATQLNQEMNRTGITVAVYESTAAANAYFAESGWSDPTAAGLIGQRATDALAGLRPFWLTEDQALLAASVRTADGRMAIILLGLQRRTDTAAFLAIGQPALLTFLAVSLPTLMLSLVFLTLIARPVKQMARMADRIAGGDYRQQVTVGGHDEIARLGKALNQMAVRLGVLEHSRKMILSGLSHELRTPITSIKAYTQGLIDNVISEAEKAEALAVISTETERLRVLVENTIQAAADPDAWPINRRPVDLAELITGVCRQMEAAARQKQVSVTCSAVPGQRALCDPYQMRQVLINVLDNALRYAPASTVVSLALTREGPDYDIAVSDEGAGIAPELLPHIFEPLVKDAASHGSGLGLYLSARIMAAHGGSIIVDETGPSGTRFIIRLPNEQADPADQMADHSNY